VTATGEGIHKFAVNCCQNLSQPATINTFDPTLDVIELTNWIAGDREVELVATERDGFTAQSQIVEVSRYGQSHIIASSIFDLNPDTFYTIGAVLIDGFSGDVDVSLTSRNINTLAVENSSRMLRSCLQE